MARPRKTIVKSEIIKVRYTATEKRLLKSFADRTGRCISAYIRDQSLDYKILTRLTEEEVTILRGLIGMATNLNQIAKEIHMGQGTHMMFSEILVSINKQIKKMK